MQVDRILTKPFVLTMLAEFALCMSVGMLSPSSPSTPTTTSASGASASPSRSPRSARWSSCASRSPGGTRTATADAILVVAGGVLAAIAVAGYVVADSLPLLDRPAAPHRNGRGDGTGGSSDDRHRSCTRASSRRGLERLQPRSLGRPRSRAAARRARARRHALRRRLAARRGVLPRRGADRPRAPGDGAFAGARPRLRGASRPSRGDRARSRLSFHGPRLRRPRDVRCAVRARPGTGRGRFRLPRLLGRRRRHARARPAGAGPARAEAHVPLRPLPHLVGSLHDRALERPAGLFAGTWSSPSATHSRSRRS